MDAKIENLLEEAALAIPTEQYNTMVADADKLDTKAWLSKYNQVFTSDPNLAVAWENEGMDKYSKSKWERMTDYFGTSDKDNPFAKSPEQLQAIWQKEFSDIPKEQFLEDIAKMSKGWEDETNARKKQAGRTRRTKEIEKDWPWYKKLLANEYSQARYIDDPNSTPFGKEGKFDPFDNKLELANIGLQGASLAGDAIPGVWGYVAGPGLRLGNDILQEAGDYGKDLKDIAYDRALDLGTSFMGEAGPNALLRAAGQSEKLGKTLGKGLQETTDYADLLKQRKEMEELWNKWVKEPDHARRMKIINEIQDEGLKNRMMALESVKPTNSKGTPSYMSKREKERQGMVKNFGEDYKLREPDEAAKLLSKGKVEPHEKSWLNKLSETPVPGKAGRAAAKAINSKGIEYPLSFVKRKTAGGVLANPNLSKPESKNDKALKESYKRTYAKDWLDLNFKPRENSGLMYEAWKELMEENGREVK